MSKKTFWWIIGIVVAIIVVILIFHVVKNSESTGNNQAPVAEVPTEPVATSSEPSASSTPASSDEYKDGTYSAEGDYASHIGPEHIEVTLTLKDDIITSATVTPGAVNPTSMHYQGLFISGYQQVVIGKDISTLTVGKVSGSSLTPKGFNDAIAKIKAEASVS